MLLCLYISSALPSLFLLCLLLFSSFIRQYFFLSVFYVSFVSSVLSLTSLFLFHYLFCSFHLFCTSFLIVMISDFFLPLNWLSTCLRIPFFLVSHLSRTFSHSSHSHLPLYRSFSYCILLFVYFIYLPYLYYFGVMHDGRLEAMIL